ncbi:MAG: hypothetical protein KME22_26900 [Hassallia sp. WJT32-NPBG1]|nr:hypothetical protein [Hassallia sp. WJT32-NPBG1]
MTPVASQMRRRCANNGGHLTSGFNFGVQDGTGNRQMFHRRAMAPQCPMPNAQCPITDIPAKE